MFTYRSKSGIAAVKVAWANGTKGGVEKWSNKVESPDIYRVVLATAVHVTFIEEHGAGVGLHMDVTLPTGYQIALNPVFAGGLAAVFVDAVKIVK